MARLEAAVHSILSSNTDITDLVSTRIYPLMLPQEISLPALTYSRISTERESAFMIDPGLSTARIQIDVWAMTMASVMDISEKVRAALHRYRDTIASVVVEESHIENESLLYESDTDIYHVVLDFMILHKET